MFQNTLRYIFTFIDKVRYFSSIISKYTLQCPEQEKQAESIVEKLCQRFRLSDDPRQWRDIAFCLSLLPFKSERSVKKLIEGLQFYRDKLHEPTVFERFTEILTKVRLPKFLSNQHVIQPMHRREAISRRINLIRSWMNLKRYASLLVPEPVL